MEKALTAVVQEACIHGVSTRAMDGPAQATGGTGVSKSQVGRLREEIDERVDAFPTRPIEGEWPCLRIDATCLKARRGGRIASVAAALAAGLAIGVNMDGGREGLGRAVGASEAEPFRTDVLRALARRGLSGVKRVVGDAREGVEAAAARGPSTARRRGRAPFRRDAPARAGESGRRVVPAFAAAASARPGHAAAGARRRRVASPSGCAPSSPGRPR